MKVLIGCILGLLIIIGWLFTLALCVAARRGDEILLNQEGHEDRK